MEVRAAAHADGKGEIAQRARPLWSRMQTLAPLPRARVASLAAAALLVIGVLLLMLARPYAGASGAAASLLHTAGGRQSTPPVLPALADLRGVTFPRAALVTVFSEARRSLLASLPNWSRNMWWMTRYTLVVLYVKDAVDPADLAALKDTRVSAPGWNVTLVPFEYDPEWQTEAYRGGGGGGAYINWLLTYAIYFDIPELAPFDYFMRFDDDVMFIRPSAADPFLEMDQRGVKVGWKQQIPDNDSALGSRLVRMATEYAARPDLQFPVSDVWRIVTDPAHRGPNTRSVWRPYLTAGCVEIYATSVFRNPHYRAFLQGIDAVTDLKKRAYWEQEVKTVWQQMYVPLTEWRCMACHLPLYHKSVEIAEFWFFHEGCDYERAAIRFAAIFNKTKCNADPSGQLRIC